MAGQSYVDMAEEGLRMAETLERIEALASEWEAAAQKPMPEKAAGESGQDQGVRIGVWHSVKTAATELRAALDGAP